MVTPGPPSDGSVPRLRDHHISLTTGFLLDQPLTVLPGYFKPWMDIGTSAAELVGKRQLRHKIDQMELLEAERLTGHRELRLANLMLSFMTSAYIWQEGDQNVAKKVPPQLAVPMCHVAEKLDVPFIVTHTGLCLANWTLADRAGPLEVSNMECVVPFPGGSQASWFFLVTAQTEITAIPGLKAIERAQLSVLAGDTRGVQASLDTITATLVTMTSVVSRLFENLSPDVFYNVVRPYLSGWGGGSSPAPDGIVFEGVSQQPIKAIGGSAAQSPPVQCFDALLGVEHSVEKQKFLKTMRQYMLPSHRNYIEAVKAGPSVRHYVTSREDNDLTESYNAAVKALTAFRTYHIQLTTRYIVLPGCKKKSERFEAVSKAGTGGTDLIPFLKSIRDSTKTHNIQ